MSQMSLNILFCHKARKLSKVLALCQKRNKSQLEEACTDKDGAIWAKDCNGLKQINMLKSMTIENKDSGQLCRILGTNSFWMLVNKQK